MSTLARGRQIPGITSTVLEFFRQMTPGDEFSTADIEAAIATAHGADVSETERAGKAMRSLRTRRLVWYVVDLGHRERHWFIACDHHTSLYSTGMVDPGLDEQFQAFVSPCPITGCWWWTGSTDRKGYGQLRVWYRLRYAHRLALELAGVEVPARKFVCHRCDQPACVNPAHLFVGSHTDNMRDMVRKGRHWSGFKGPKPEGHLSTERAGLGCVRIVSVEP